MAHRRWCHLHTGGPWGSGLLVLSIAALAQGVAFSTTHRFPGALGVLAHYVPNGTLGLLWLVAGGWSLWRSLRPPQHPTDVLPLVGVLSLWAVVHLLYWLVLGITHGLWNTHDLLAALAWGMLAAYITAMARCVNPPTKT